MKPVQFLPSLLSLPLWLGGPLVRSQAVSEQTVPVGSSFKLSLDQIKKASLSGNLRGNIEVTTDFERSNWATGSVSVDPFYSLPKDVKDKFATLKPGTLLKVEAQTNTTSYTLAPNLALSRILFTTETFNGSVVPASAYILWPFSPNLQGSSTKIQTVVWGHGTSGLFGDCAPSHVRNLWYQFSAPFTLALAGYAVVGPDYQGLGVNHTVGADGRDEPLRHPWGATAPLANDLVYAHQAARAAFPTQLSDEFVVMGHSQGGGAAWAVAERQAATPVPGYLGAVAASPAADLLRISDRLAAAGQIGPSPQALLLAWAAQAVFPAFALADVLTPLGIAKLELLAELGGCQSTMGALFGGKPEELVKEGWHQNYYVQQLMRLTGSGQKRPVAGPMLVVMGTADEFVPESAVRATVIDTCEAHKDTNVEYLAVNGTTHVPTLFAAQKQWLAWIADRFVGRPATRSCPELVLSPYLPIEHYQKELNYFISLAQYPYQTA